MYKPRQEEIEKRYGKPLPDVLLMLLNQHGTKKAVSEKIGVAQSTVGVWINEYGIEPVTRWEKTS